MESERRSKKRLALGEVRQAGTSVKRINIFSNVNNVSKVSKRQQNTNEDDLNIVAEKSFNLVKNPTNLFRTWGFGTINIRTGKEKDEGAKIYAVAKEIARAGLTFCCLQEVRYRNTGNKLIRLDTGEEFKFHWCGQKRRRDAGVGIMIKVHRDIEINTPDVLDPRLMAINLKVHGFNIRVVNGYSPTNCDGSEYQKETFYRLLTKSSIKDQKHQKVIVTGDFNAETGLAKYKSCYDGESLIQDNECNDNGCRLKSFCKSQKLCISSSFFDYTMIDRYTWYSNDKKTNKINDYVLTEKYVQQYVTQCIVMRDYNFDSDYRLLKTTLTTPCTRKARRITKKPTNKLLPDIKSLHNPNIQATYTATVHRKLRENATLHQTVILQKT